MKALYPFILFCLLAAACKKTENENLTNNTVPAQKTRAELLTDAKWVPVYAYDTYINVNTHDTVTSVIQFHPCSLDDTIFFTPVTKKMVLHKGKEKCSEPFEVDSNSTWMFTNNDKELKTFGGFVPDENYIIEQLTADSLTWHFGFIGYNSLQTTIVYRNRK